MKPKRLGRGLKGLIKSSDPDSLPPARKTVPPTVKPTVPPPAKEAAVQAAEAKAKAAKVAAAKEAAAKAAAAKAAEVAAAEAEAAAAAKAAEAEEPSAPAEPTPEPIAEVPADDPTPEPVVEVPPPEAVAEEPVVADEPAIAERAAPPPPPTSERIAAPSEPATEKAPAAAIRQIPVGDVRPNPYQPRMSFADDDLDELKASIAEHGVLQPIVVRPAAVGFELIAGERRLRATTALGHDDIPAIVRRAADEEMQTLALVENLQRVDLNAIEKAKALKAMMRNFGLTQEEVATKVGKARTSISNVVRLLDLPVVIQDLVSDGHLSGSQARAVLLAHGVERRIALAKRAVKQGLTVRQIERMAKAERAGAAEPKAVDPYVADLEGRLREALGTRVQLKAKGKGGSIVIGYHDANELDRLLDTLGAN